MQYKIQFKLFISFTSRMHFIIRSVSGRIKVTKQALHGKKPEYTKEN